MTEDAAAPETAAERERGESRLAVVAAILLGLAATLTAISAYQAALRDGEALDGYQEAAAKLSDANYFYSQGNQTFGADQALFVEFAAAGQQDEPQLVEYLKTLMRPELLEAVEWWRLDADAITPFDDDPENPYVIADFAEAERLAAESEEANKEAKKAGSVGDEFELATVLLALTLFFAGIATLFRRRFLSWSLLGVGAVSLVLGGLQLLAATG